MGEKYALLVGENAAPAAIRGSTICRLRRWRIARTIAVGAVLALADKLIVIYPSLLTDSERSNDLYALRRATQVL